MKNSIKTIGVIGNGRFGRFFGKEILPMVFPHAKIILSSRTKHDNFVKELKIICRSDLVILAVPIREMESILIRIRKLLKPGSIVMDVCSVKILPVRWMKEILPKTVHVIASHPLFGPSSYAILSKVHSDCSIVFHPIHIPKEIYISIRDQFSQALHVVEMTPDEHDRKAAEFQFVSHFMGKILNNLSIERSSIDTPSAGLMYDLKEILRSDSEELFLDLYTYNPYANQQLVALKQSFQKVLQSLHTL